MRPHHSINIKYVASARPLSVDSGNSSVAYLVLLLSFYYFNLCASALFACAQFVSPRPQLVVQWGLGVRSPATRSRSRSAHACPHDIATMLIVSYKSHFVLLRSISSGGCEPRLPPSDNFNVATFIVILTEIPTPECFRISFAFRQSYSISNKLSASEKLF